MVATLFELGYKSSSLPHCTGDACSLSSSLRQAQEERVLSLVKASHRQQISGQGHGGHPACDSHPSNHPMERLLHNFQVDFPERVLHPPGTSSFGRPDELSHPGVPPGLRGGQWEYSAIHRLRNGREVTDASQWAEAAGMSREAMPCVITPNNNSADAFSVSVAETPKKLSHSVIHGPLRSYSEEEAPRPRPRAGRPRKKPERPNNGLPSSTAPGAAPIRMRSPRRCNPRKQWLKDAVGPEHDPWRQQGGRLLQPPAGPPELNGNYAAAEMLRRRGFLSHQECAPVAPPPFNGIDSNGLFAHMNGGNALSAAPPSEGRGAAGFAPDYGHYNGHLNGRLNGNYNVQCKVNLGAPDVADKKAMMEEKLRSPELLQYKPRSQHTRELLWAQALSLHSWPSKLKEEGQMYLPAMSHSDQSKVEPERFHKTIQDDLESLHRANRIHQNGGEFNNYLEAAIENAMSELNKLTGNRDGQMDGPKSKRKKIPR